MGFDREVTYEIVEHIGVIATHATGWTKELNLVSWNKGRPKYDIRDWDPKHEHMSKGATFTEEEIRKVAELMGAKMRPVRSMSRPKEQNYER